MNKKLLAAIIILVALIGGGYAIFHKSPAKPSTAAGTTAPVGSTSTNDTSATIVQTKETSGVGQYLANGDGYALYTYGNDTNGVSNCTGSCLYDWPVYDASNAPSTLPDNVTVITRSDGSKQYAYKGLPLYTFSGDSIGQVSGDGVSDFHVAKP